MNSGQTFGVDWPHLLGQIASFLVVSAVFIGLAIHATRRVLRRYIVTRDEARTIMWLAAIWLVPGLGPLFAMSATDTGNPSLRVPDGAKEQQ